MTSGRRSFATKGVFMWMGRCVLIAGVVLAGACSGRSGSSAGSSSSGGGSSGTSDMASFLAAYFHAYCVHDERCAAEQGRAYSSVSACDAELSSYIATTVPLETERFTL